MHEAPGAVVARRHRAASSLIFTWRSRMTRRSAEVAAPSFVPVVLEEPGEVPTAATQARPGRPAGGMAGVVLRNGRVLRMPATTDPARQAAFAAALET
ncbi:hypothetical protein [Muricoccus nepalensis]|uniref:hypothetical protein n=1 Tax=Muricoccus nepalensis TaxID=1854500 RepID=UPI0011263633|nr:hypothetical protein [Roseomonas nepalensis]